MKKIKVLLLVMVFVLNLSCMAFAQNEVGTIDLDKAEEKYYEEKGQIDLDGVKFSLDRKGNLKISGEDEYNCSKVAKELEKSKNLTLALKNYADAGDEPIAIGYTRVYLKEVTEDNGNIHLEPITVEEKASATATGTSSNKGNLTLYTTAFATVNGITSQSVAQWSTKYVISSENKPAAYDDYMSISTDDAYIVNSSTFSAKLLASGADLAEKFYSKCDEADSSVVYRFKEFQSGLFQIEKATATIHCAKKKQSSSDPIPETVKSISKYVHTWNSVSVNVGFNTAGQATFSLSPAEKGWQISSGVNVAKK